MLRGALSRLWSQGLFLSAIASLAFVLVPPTLSATASITFTFDFPGSQPDHYEVVVNADGHATYDSTGKSDSVGEQGEPFHLNVTLSSSTSERIFDLAKRANYFRGTIDSGKKNLAMTGVKTLAYKDDDKTGHATYNYSQIQAIQNLTTFFQDFSTTMEFGRRIEFYRRYQKLALDDELKRMEAAAKQNALEGLPALGPILQQIASDPTIINPVRSRAQRILELATAQSK